MSIDLDNVYGDAKYYKQIPVYPVQMKYIAKFYDAVQCLMIPKNEMQQPYFLKMSYLKFIVEISTSEEILKVVPENAKINNLLRNLLSLIFRTEDIQFYTDKREDTAILIDGEHHISSRDFDKIRKIIGEQNLLNLEESKYSGELKRKMDEARAFKNKRNDKMADLEQQIVAYKCVSKESYTNIKELTIYQFRKELLTHELIKSSEVLQNAKYSGMVSFKEGFDIPHWLDRVDINLSDDDLLMSKDKLDSIARENGLMDS